MGKSKMAVSSQHRRVVGKDKNGNVFVEIYKHEKWCRMVEGEPFQLPVIWRQWLYYLRESAPTPSEIEEFEKNQADFIERGKAYDAKEEQLRIQESILKNVEKTNKSP